ncbi:DUF2505 domain-containing protein [Marinobacteraceae bacterium S3BR75-40.1]
MEVQLEHPFEASPERLLDTFFDEKAIKAKNDALGYRNVRVVALERSEDTARLVVQREVQASAPIPSALKSFHQEWSSIEQEEHWERGSDGQWQCELRIRVKGVPVKLRGAMTLQEEGQRTTNCIRLKVDCNVPLMGKKIARFLAEDSRVKMDAEYEVLRNQLS